MNRPLVLVEDDVAIRPLQVLLDPDCEPERQAAFSAFMHHDIPDFMAWCEHRRMALPAAFPARVVPVATESDLAARISDAACLVVEDMRVGRDLIARAPSLKLLVKFGTALDGIDLEACRARGIEVHAQRRRTNIAVAEHSVALMLALAKKLNIVGGSVTPAVLEALGHPPARFDRKHTANSNWGRFSGLVTLHGATLGLLGIGEIGGEVARMASGFGMKTLYWKRTPLPRADERDLRVEFADLDDLLARSDIVSVHLPSNKQTHGLIDAEKLRRMRPGALLVNTARAEIVDRDALLDALRTNHLGGAGFDVMWEEPAREDDPLLQCTTLLATPHLAGGARFNGMHDILDIAQKIDAALSKG